MTQSLIATFGFLFPICRIYTREDDEVCILFLHISYVFFSSNDI